MPSDQDTPPGPRQRPLSQATAEKVFRTDYSRVQYAIVDFLADHLADTSRAFGGDLQQALLLAIIGQAQLAAMLGPAAEPRDDGGIERRGMTAARLADATGIARETVRRKLLALQAQGWIERDGSAWCLVLRGDNAAARVDLAGVDDRGITRAARLFARLAAVATPPGRERRPDRPDG